jgi:hypothetical protein
MCSLATTSPERDSLHVAADSPHPSDQPSRCGESGNIDQTRGTKHAILHEVDLCGSPGQVRRGGISHHRRHRIDL